MGAGWTLVRNPPGVPDTHQGSSWCHRLFGRVGSIDLRPGHRDPAMQRLESCMSTTRTVILMGLVLLVLASATLADEPLITWPQELQAGSWVVTMYQPQIDSFEGNNLEARAAVSVKRADGTGQPEFGAVWISAKVDVDREARLVSVREVRIPEVRFADSREEDRAALSRLLETEMPKWEIELDLDQVIADLGGDAEYATTPGLKSDPPVFIYSTEPAVLLIYDGEPKTEAMIGAEGFESVVNTPFPVVRQKGANGVLPVRRRRLLVYGSGCQRTLGTDNGSARGDQGSDGDVRGTGGAR